MVSLSLSLSLSHEGQVRHYHVKEDIDKKYYISEKHRFATISELIEYHKLNGGGTCANFNPLFSPKCTFNFNPFDHIPFIY